jgi:predicted 2-oxoglutarate/Fe(II)-dependent dioxygenase YbiX
MSLSADTSPAPNPAEDPAEDPAVSAALSPGDRLPFCYGMDADQRYYSFEDQAGRPAALILAGSAPPAAVSTLMEAFSAEAEAFAGRAADVRVLALAGAPGWAAAPPPPGVALVHCMDAALFEAFGWTPAVLVSDRALRLVSAADGRDPMAAVAHALAALDRLPREPAREVRYPAPVLIRPNLLDAGLCRRLIERFETGDHAAGAMASIDGDGAAVNRVDAGKKHRRDLTLDPAEALHDEAVAALSNRLVPEIAKAFQVQVAHLDRILIARYDDTGGYFRRHRDNSSAHLAYREFALSVNLNAGEYDGGRLLFPEYDDHRYDPPTGAGLVFSASLLHEAAPVTRGQRYVLLTFLHSPAAEAHRQAALASGFPQPA